MEMQILSIQPPSVRARLKNSAIVIRLPGTLYCVITPLEFKALTVLRGPPTTVDTDLGSSYF